MKKAILISIAMLAILAITMLPQAFSFCIPPNPAGDDQKFEVFGPHVNGIKMFVYSETATEFAGMDNGQIDIEDWALDAAHAASYATPNGPVTIQNYGGEAGYYLIDLNNNATFTSDDSIPGTYNPTSDINLRRAIAACVDRSDAVAFTGGYALPMYTPVPNYMGGYINTQIAPGQPLEALTYGGYTGNSTLANQILDAAGYVWNVGHTDRIDPHTGQPLNLIFYGRTGDRQLLGLHTSQHMTAVGIGNTYTGNLQRVQVTGPVFSQEYYNLYTGGWINIGPDPDYLCDLYNGSNYFHPGQPNNYLASDYPELNANLTTVKLAPTLAIGTAATIDAQYWFAYYCVGVPVFSYSGVKGYKNVPKETSTAMDPVTYPPTGDWKHLVNSVGFGVNSWWSTLDMQTYGNLYPNLNVWYGFSSTTQLQNYVYAQWYWDSEVLGRIYDGGWARDPYLLTWTVPQLFKSYSVGNWTDPITHENKTAVTISLRPDAYWQDGQPITVADFYYTLVEISKDMLAKHFPPPWWYPTVQFMRSVEVIDDYNMVVLLDVYSAWAAGWVIGSAVIPKHIWKPIVDASINDGVHNYIQATTPDPDIIGSGPYIWVTGTGLNLGDTIVMAANKPGTYIDHRSNTPAGHNYTSPGYWQYDPVYANIIPPGSLVKQNLNPAATSATITLNFTLSDLWTDGSLVVNKYIYVYYPNGTGIPGSGAGGLMPGYPQDVTLDPITPYPTGISDNETLTLTLPKKTLVFIKLAVHIKGPTPLVYTEAWDSQTVTYTVTNPWVSHWVNVTIPLWLTIKQDIAGTTLYDVLGYASYPTYIKNEAPAPDTKVDVKDIAAAAKAFGTVPGSPAWNTVADITGDFKVDVKDIAAIAKLFGY